MEMLSRNNPTVAALRTKVAKTENSLCYSAGRNMGKFAGGHATPTGTRFCEPCNSNTLGVSMLGRVRKMLSERTPYRMVPR